MKRGLVVQSLHFFDREICALWYAETRKEISDSDILPSEGTVDYCSGHFIDIILNF